MDFVLSSPRSAKYVRRVASNVEGDGVVEVTSTSNADGDEETSLRPPPRNALTRAMARWRDDPRSCLLFARESRFRVGCERVSTSKWFQGFVIALMVASSAVVAVVAPDRDSGSNEAQWVSISSYCVTAVFAIEAVLKICALGFAFGKDAYLTSRWNQFDFILVVLSVVLAPLGGAHVVTVRLLRALQPLRVFARYRSGRLVMRTMARALPLLGDVGLFLLWFLIVFAVGGVTIFGGKITSRWYGVPPSEASNAAYVFPTGSGVEICAALTTAWLGDETFGTDGTYPNEYDSSCQVSQLYTNRSSTEYCCDSGMDPYDGFVNFDNVGRASIVALNGMTIDGWNELLNPMSYAAGYTASVIWFGFVVIVGGFFVMELFTSVICATLTQIGLRDEEEALQEAVENFDEDQDETNDTDNALEEDADIKTVAESSDANELPTSPTRLICMFIATHESFNTCITALIVLNTILMMAQHYEQASGFTTASTVLEIIFLAFFVIEMVIKHIGYGFKGYWRLKENCIDGFIVVTGVVSTAAESQGFSLSFLRLMRIFRAFRTIRVIRQNREFRKIVASALIGLNDMWAFLVVWLVFTVIFSIYGFQLFTGLGTLDEERLTFKSFPRSALTLFVVATGEDSFAVAWSTMVAYGSDWVVLYMIAWIFLSTVILSLVLGILIDSCSLVEVEEDKLEHEEIEALRLKDAIERAEAIVLSKEGKLKRVMQNATFALSALTSTAKAKSTKFMRRVDLIETVKKEEKVVKDTFPKSKFMEKKIMGERVANDDEDQMSIWPMNSTQGGHPDATTQHIATSPVRGGGKLAAAKAQRLQKNAVDEVLAVKIFLVSVGLMKLPPGETLKMSEHALEAARLRLTPPLSARKSGEKSFKEKMMEKLRQKNVQKVADTETGDNNEGENEEGDVSAEVAGPWAQAVFGSKVRVIKADSGIPGVIITKDGDMIPIYDESIKLERYKARAHAFVTHRWVENFVLLIIIIGSALLATETHTWPSASSKTAEVYGIIEVIFTVIFCIEMALKMFALGIYSRPTAYFRNSFNVLDFVVVVTSLVTLLAGNSSGGAVRSLRLLRIMRPLRSIRRLPGLRLVIMTLVSAIPAVSYVCLLGVVSMSIFALLGMELFMGKMWSCYVVENATTFTTKATCEAAGGVWRNAKFNFDNFGAALLSTFLMHAGDDWQEIMWVAMDITGEGTGLQTDANQYAAFYFVIAVALGNFFWLNLLVTALIDNFNKMTIDDKLTFVTPAQRRWQQAIVRAAEKDDDAWRYVSPPPGATLWARARKIVHSVCKHRQFDYFMLSVVAANTLELLFQTADMSQAVSDLHFYLSIMFTVIYAVEMSMLLMAQGCRRYFGTYWNWLDSFVVFVAVVQAVGQGADSSSSVFEYLQLVRLLRLLKLVKAHSGLRSLFNTFMMSLPGVFNVAALSLLVLFSYSILGVSLFGDYTGPYEGAVLSEFSNFETFSGAMSALFAVYTGGWVGTFAEVYQTEACLRTEPPFLDEASMDCSYDYAAVVFFITFVLIALFLLGNLFVAIVLERFTVSSDAEGLYDHAEVIEVIKHTIQLRKLALKIQQKATEARAPGGALYNAPRKQSWREKSATMMGSKRAKKVVAAIRSRAESRQTSMNEKGGDGDAGDRGDGRASGLAVFKSAVEKLKAKDLLTKGASGEDDDAAPVDVGGDGSSDDEGLSNPADLAAFFGESRFGASTTAQAPATVDDVEYVDDDDDYYGFSPRTRAVVPGENTPVEAMSERLSVADSHDDRRTADYTSEGGDSMDDFATPGTGFRFNSDGSAPQSALARHLQQQEHDYLMAFRDENGVGAPPVRQSSLLGSESAYTSDGDATYQPSEPSEAMSDGEFADLSFRL